MSRPFNPLMRAPINQSLDVGIRAINSLLTVGRGQRLGLFAGSGVGKSVLLGMMARYTAGGCHRRRPDRRTRSRGQGVHRAKPRCRRPAPLRRRRRAGRRQPLVAPAGRGLRHHHRRTLPRPGQASAADHGLADALCHGPARNFAGRRRTAGHARLSAQRVSPACPSWSSGQATAPAAAARSRPSTPCWPRATTSKIRLPTRRAPFSTAISCLSRHLADAGHYPAIDIEQSISRAMTNLIGARAPRVWCALSSSSTLATSAPAI